MAKAITAQEKPMNVASIVLGALSLVPVFWIFPVGLILGIVGLAMHRRGGDNIGFGLSLAGTLIGILAVGIWIAVIVISANK